jgi:hypothetical protein
MSGLVYPRHPSHFIDLIRAVVIDPTRSPLIVQIFPAGVLSLAAWLLAKKKLLFTFIYSVRRHAAVIKPVG